MRKLAFVTAEKRKEIATKRERLVEALKKEKWHANAKYGHDDQFLVSPNDHYAITVKTQVITLHDASRNYCKILSMEIDHIVIHSDHIECGILKMKFHD